MVSIGQIKFVYEQIKPLLEDENIQRYGNTLIQTGKNGVKKIIGHLETRKANKQKMLSTSGTENGVQAQLAGNMSGITQQLITKGCSSALGGLTSLGWANLAVSGINLGVTAVGMIVISKKINNLTQEVQQINGKLDSIIDEMQQIKAGIVQLSDNEIRKLYKEADTQIGYMQNSIDRLSSGKYSEYTVGEAEKNLMAASKSLNDYLSRYNDPKCEIAIGLDVIMAHFYTFVSLMKSYISAVYLHEKNLHSYDDYEQLLRNFCSKSMIESIQNVYRQSASLFISPQDLGLITAVYKGIMVEQISEIKSQRQILELVDYNEYRRINEQLQEGSASGEIAFVQYS